MPSDGTVFMVGVGDPHYTESAWIHRQDTAGDADLALRQAVDVALQYDVPLLAAGDIMDSARPSPEVVHKFVERVRPLRKLLYIRGNHDDRSPRSWPDLSGVCEWIGHGEVVQVGPARVVGLDWTPGWALKPTLEKLQLREKRADVFTCHQSWKQIQTMGVAEGDLADIEMGSDSVVFTGDYHQSLELAVPGTEQYIQVISPGSLHLTTIDEEVQKYVYLFHYGVGGGVRVERRPLVCRQVKVMELRDYNGSSIVAEVAALEPTFPYPDTPLKPFVRLNYPADVSAKEVVKAAAGKCVLFCNPAPTTREGATSSASEEMIETLETAIPQATQDPAVASAAATLLRTPAAERAGVVQQMRLRWLEAYKATGSPTCD